VWLDKGDADYGDDSRHQDGHEGNGQSTPGDNFAPQGKPEGQDQENPGRYGERQRPG
jgi:hypothetical protein